jgi:photosystem II stability/assembly factor-like uncharacterized protein
MRRIVLIIVSALLLISSSTLAAEHWVVQYTNTTGNSLRSVQGLSSGTALVAGDNLRILKTINGGGTWTTKNFAGGGSTFYSINFPNFPTSSVGFASGGTPSDGPVSGFVYKSTDGGESWAAVTQPTNSSSLYDIFFIDNNTGWTCSSNAFDENLEMYKTTNGGSTWNSSATGLFAERTFMGLQFLDANNGWAVGFGQEIDRTTNGGANWSAVNSGTTADFWGVQFLSSTTGYIVGTNSTVLKTTNGTSTPVTWTSKNTGIPAATGLRALYFADENNGWVVGLNGVIYHTTNGGDLWTAETSGTTEHLYAVHGYNANHVWAVGGGVSGKVILKRVVDPTDLHAKHGRFTTFSQGGIYTNFTITGIGLDSGAAPTVTFPGDAGIITAGSVTSYSDTSVVLPVTFNASTSIGNHTLRLTRSDGAFTDCTISVLADSAGPTYSSLKINGGDYTSGMSIPFVTTFTADLSDVTGLSVDPTDDLEFTLWIVSGSNTFYKTFTGSDIYTRLTSTTGSFRVVPNHVINFSTGAEVAFGSAVGVATPFTSTFTAKDVDGNQGNSAMTLQFAGQAQGEKTISNVLVPVVKNAPIPIQFESKENLGVKELPIFSSTQMVSKVTANIVTGTNKVIWDVKTFSGAKAPAGMYIIMIQGVKGKIPVVHWQ